MFAVQPIDWATGGSTGKSVTLSVQLAPWSPAGESVLPKSRVIGVAFDAALADFGSKSKLVCTGGTISSGTDITRRLVAKLHPANVTVSNELLFPVRSIAEVLAATNDYQAPAAA